MGHRADAGSLELPRLKYHHDEAVPCHKVDVPALGYGVVETAGVQQQCRRCAPCGWRRIPTSLRASYSAAKNHTAVYRHRERGQFVIFTL